MAQNQLSWQNIKHPDKNKKNPDNELGENITNIGVPSVFEIDMILFLKNKN